MKRIGIWISEALGLLKHFAIDFELSLQRLLVRGIRFSGIFVRHFFSLVVDPVPWTLLLRKDVPIFEHLRFTLTELNWSLCQS